MHKVLPQTDTWFYILYIAIFQWQQIQLTPHQVADKKHILWWWCHYLQSVEETFHSQKSSVLHLGLGGIIQCHLHPLKSHSLGKQQEFSQEIYGITNSATSKEKANEKEERYRSYCSCIPRPPNTQTHTTTTQKHTRCLQCALVLKIWTGMTAELFRLLSHTPFSLDTSPCSPSAH